MKIETYDSSEIDELLEALSPLLIQGYEKTVMSEGTTLKNVNDEYKKVFTRQEKVSRAKNITSKAVSITIWLCIFSTALKSMPIMIGFGVVFLLIGLVWIVFSNWEYRLNSTISKHGSKLQNFRWKLESLWGNEKCPYLPFSEEDIRRILVYDRVKTILLNEHDCNSVRHSMELCAEGLYFSAGNVLESRRKLEEMLMAAESFGLKFERRQLFEEAEAHLKK